MKRPELLSPAGNLEKLRTALLYGADALYTGVPGLSLRAATAEMSIDELATGAAEAHAKGARLYAAFNIFARDADLAEARKILPLMAQTGVDALIVSDPGLVRLARELIPEMPLHLSTQANTTNSESVRFWRDWGIKRIILARELTLKEISEIAACTGGIELEIFVHGAMCMAYSGRCYLSALRNRRSANAGDCTQPCRWEYVLHESSRPGDPLILEEDERFSYLLSSKDLCLMEHLPDVLATGVSAIKIEGRMKSSYYVAVATRAYRQALDALVQQKKHWCAAPWLKELETISHRGYTTGFAFSEEKINETSPDIKTIQTHKPAGIVLGFDETRKLLSIEVRNRLRTQDKVELLLRDDTLLIDATLILDENKNPVSQAHTGSRIYLPSPVAAPAGAILRKQVISSKQSILRSPVEYL
ncbi:MAG TPA: U32 family peptidase [Smithellaceae bacterium]|jgi:putative protease|nr:U32 family peptidase [Smithellaceae bacterium]